MADNTQKGTGQEIKIDMADRKMKAFISVKAPEKGMPQSVNVNDLNYALEKAGVKYGIKEGVTNDIIAGKRWGEKFLVAIGTEPITGEDARLEYFFPTEVSLKPQVKENGRIDYKELSLVNSVEKDFVLVKKTAAILGTKGVDVTGTAVNAINGKDINLSLGPGVIKDKDDPLLIKAAVDGVVFFNPRNGNLEVQQLYVIPGSVNYSTGNVHVKSSVEIRGDVESGFSIKTPYNVEVKGVVEVATITCDGTLKVKDGILGDSTYAINVGGDLHSGYLNNVGIRCSGSVYVATEIRNAFIECDDEVMLMKPNGVILGGKITAASKVTAPTIGNLYNVPTEIEVGIIPKFKDQYLAKEKERAAAQKQLDEFMQKISMIAQTSSNGINDPRLVAYKRQWNECSEKVEKLTQEAKEFHDAYLNVDNPGVYVSKTVFPGVIIRIKHVTYEVQEELSHVMFKLVEDQIAHLQYR